MGLSKRKFLILLLVFAGCSVIPKFIPQVHAAGYSLLVTSSRTQESDTPGVLLAINVTGATIGATYKFTFQVTDPSGNTKQGTNQTAAGGATSRTFVLSINYPNGPGFGTHINYVGNYTINVQQNNPSNIASVARGQFQVGLTDQTSYQRTSTVSIIARGYANSSPVNINVTQSGYSAPGFPKTLTTSATGTLSTTWLIPANLASGLWTVTLYGSPAKTVADSQPFMVYPANVTVSQLNVNQTSLERTQAEAFTFTASYPNGSPVQTGGTSIRITESGGTPVYVVANYSATLVAYSATYKVQESDPVGSWTASIAPNTFNDGYGNSGPSTSVVRGFTVYPTNVTISRLDLSQSALTRTNTESFSFTASYPNGMPVTTGGTVIEITESDGITSFPIQANYSSASGTFLANYRVRPEDQVGSWVAVIDPSTFNDGYGNGGPSATVVRGFTVQPAILSVTLSVSNQTYNVGQGIPIYARVAYPDGNIFSNGTVTVTLSSNGTSFKSLIPLTYVPAQARWATVYTVTSDNPSGLWLVTVDASDAYGNTGKQTGSAVASVPPSSPPPSAQAGPFTTSTFVILAGIVGATALLAFLLLRRRSKGTAMKLDLTVVDNEVDKIKSGEFYQNIKKQIEETDADPSSRGTSERKDSPPP